LYSRFGVSVGTGSARLARVRRGKGEGYEKGEEKQVEDGRGKGGCTLACAMNSALDGVAVVVYDDPTPCVIVSSGISFPSPPFSLRLALP